MKARRLRTFGIVLLLTALLLANLPGGNPTAAIAAARLGAPLTSLTPALQELIAQHEGTVGLYLRDVKSGQTLTLRADTAFPAASTFKLPLVLYVLRLVEQGKARLDEQLTLQEADWEDGTGLLQAAAPGTKFTVERLLELAIRSSDNMAKNMLLRRFGRPNVWAFEQSRGGQLTRDKDEVNLTSPADLGLYMRTVADGKGLSAASRAKLLNWMQHTDFPVRIAAGVPDGVTVAHKIGTLPGVVNDVGLVQVDQLSFVLAICTKDLGEGEAEQLIAELTGAIYTFYAKAGSGAQPGL